MEFLMYRYGESIVKSQTLINLMKVTFLLAVIAAVIVALWNSIPVTLLLATVSWNG
jgi:hypothetical protein